MKLDILVIDTAARGSSVKTHRQRDALLQRILSAKGGPFRVSSSLAVFREELLEDLLETTPTLLEWWGATEGELATPEELGGFFKTLASGPVCVVLLGGFTLEGADSLLGTVPWVLGFEAPPAPEPLKLFSDRFYGALGAEASYAESFNEAFQALEAAGLSGSELPRIASRPGSAPEGAGLDWQRPWKTDRSGPNREVLQAPIGSRGGGFSVGTTLGGDRGEKGPGQRGSEGKSKPDDDPKAYPLWFGTNRAPNAPGDPSAGFGNGRADRLHLGVCKVTVPRSHKIGSVGSPWWKRLVTLKDDRLRLDPKSLRLLEREAFWANLQRALAEHPPGERDGVVFLHGYNVSFEEAALRAAQIGYDLQVPGVMAFYSWPSKAKLSGYLADGATVEASEPFITEFLRRFARESGVEKVHVIAHSMGNRGLLRAVNRILTEAGDETSIPFGQILLAAPDVDQDVFRQLSAAYTKLSKRTTLYVSAKDRALASSSLLQASDRAGYTPPVTVVPGIDTIEVTQVDLSLLGHGYVAAARPVLTDMHALLRGDQEPKERMGLRAAVTPAGEAYWVVAG